MKSLSGGMKRRLNMAAGLIHRPKLVLMDEPTVGVDPQSRNRIFEMIEKLHGEGMSIIYTTHYMEEAERLCDRVAIIDHGRIIAQGSKDELVHNTFSSRSQVLARFENSGDGVAAWVKQQGGVYDGGAAQFTIEHASEIAGLLDAAAARRARARRCIVAEAQSGIGIPAVDGKGAARLILSIVRTGLIALRRDRGALALELYSACRFFFDLCRDLRRTP